MEYITGISQEYYNPTYFNILESIEYEMLVYEHMTVMDSYFDIVTEEVADTTYTKPKGMGQRLWGAIRNKNADGKETKGSAFLNKMKEYFKIMREKIKEILRKFMQKVDELFGLRLLVDSPNIDDDTRAMIFERQTARERKDYAESDRLRDLLAEKGISVKDTPDGPIWQYI
jgi:cysteinyl-tRNA synthetase